MKRIGIMFGKEFSAYFNSPIAYVLLVVFLVFQGWWFFWFRPFFVIEAAEMREFFGILPFVFLFVIPAMSMRLWAEERRTGTIEVLLTLPLNDHEVILGKFLASVAFLAVALALTFPIYLVVSYVGSPDPGPIVASYLAALLVGAAYLSIGLFASALTKNQIVAFILALVACLALFLVGYATQLSGLLTETLTNVLSYIGLGVHYESMSRGVIDSRDVVYYLSIIGLFLFLNARVLAGRNLT
ncbi:MAG: ABC transporter permease subunit [Deltaproteobacteria bacterium]|nr:ABC transporter permease subunit [Deltaproteobacteria bacterium]